MDAQTIAAFVFGSFFVIAMLTIGCVIAFRENPKDIPPFAMFIFRVVLALAASGVAAILPGFLEIESNVAEFGLRAGGAMAVFLLIYRTNPPSMVQDHAAKAASKNGIQSGEDPVAERVARTPVPGSRLSGSLVTPEESVAETVRPLPPEDIALAKLPSTSADLFGRDEQLTALDEAWENGKTNVVTLVAFGGVGKTALVNVWLGGMREEGFRGARRVYGWSFYSQGTSEDRQASGDEFLSAALKWFGVEEKDVPKSAWDRGERLAQLCREQRTLLILDGLEPLQHAPGKHAGKLRDPGVQSLLRELAAGNPGLCVVSTRIAVDDLKDFEGTSVARMDLEDLSPQAGGQLLAKLGVEGSDNELEQDARDFGGHALALMLLARYLAVVHDRDVRKRNEVPPLIVEPRDGDHAKRVMECYERWL